MSEMSDGQALLFIHEWNAAMYARRDEKEGGKK